MPFRSAQRSSRSRRLLELVLAAGLVGSPRFRRPAGIVLAGFPVVVFPANALWAVSQVPTMACGRLDPMGAPATAGPAPSRQHCGAQSRALRDAPAGWLTHGALVSQTAEGVQDRCHAYPAGIMGIRIQRPRRAGTWPHRRNGEASHASLTSRLRLGGGMVRSLAVPLTRSSNGVGGPSEHRY